MTPVAVPCSGRLKPEGRRLLCPTPRLYVCTGPSMTGSQWDRTSLINSRTSLPVAKRSLSRPGPSSRYMRQSTRGEVSLSSVLITSQHVTPLELIHNRASPSCRTPPFTLSSRHPSSSTLAHPVIICPMLWVRCTGFFTSPQYQHHGPACVSSVVIFHNPDPTFATLEASLYQGCPGRYQSI